MEGKNTHATLRTLTEEDRHRIDSEGERIFRDVITEAERRQHHGGYVAIDITDDRYAFGDSIEEADDHLEPLPEGHFVYFQRIGLPFRLPRSLRL